MIRTLAGLAVVLGLIPAASRPPGPPLPRSRGPPRSASAAGSRPR